MAPFEGRAERRHRNWAARKKRSYARHPLLEAGITRRRQPAQADRAHADRVADKGYEQLNAEQRARSRPARPLRLHKKQGDVYIRTDKEFIP